MRKVWLLIVMFLLMHCVAFTWKVMPMAQEDLTLFGEDRWWAITLITSVLCGIAAVLIEKEDD